MKTMSYFSCDVSILFIINVIKWQYDACYKGELIGTYILEYGYEFY